MAEIVTRTAADLRVGDKLLLPESPRDDPITVDVAVLRPTRSGRIRVWVRSTHETRTLHEPWLYGTYSPTDPIERVED